MNKYLARVEVRLKKSVLDPQGTAVKRGLATLGFAGVREVRIGKLIEVRLEAESREAAEALVLEASGKLLANPVIEEFEVQVEEDRG
ncbi:MAG: phosphoribosylformylglycinamidine synthase subunit PurS [Chitinophagales bacterium]